MAHPWDNDYIEECPYDCYGCGNRDCDNYKTLEEWDTEESEEQDEE